jgi:two-component system chemotaxis sensor kinase CheA
MAPDPYRYFRLEARDLLDQFAKGVLDLEGGSDGGPAVQRLLRLAHTLKGAARVVRQGPMADAAHAIEDALSPYRDGADKVPQQRIDTVLRHIDALNARLRELDTPPTTAMPTPAAAPTATPAAPTKPEADESWRAMRADATDMDAVLDGIAEAHTLLAGLRVAARHVEQVQHLGELLAAQLAPRDGGPSRLLQTVPSTPSERAFATADELRRNVAGLGRRLGDTVDQMDRELRQLRDNAEQLRLVPASAMFTALQRTARDVAQAQDKHVVFDGRGGEVRLDGQVLATLQAALVQIVRNAVAHGIETEAERRAAGKPAAGQVSLRVSRRGNRIAFLCRDDGRGLDFDAVRRIAVRRGLMTSDDVRHRAEDLVRLLLRGGISTSEAVTEQSGRGVGLDVVRDAMELLGGDVSVQTEAGRGTSIELVTPLSLAAFDALLVEAGGSVAAIPLDAVRHSMRLVAGDVTWHATGASIVYEKTAIPFLPLPRALHDIKPQAARSWSAVVVAAADGAAAIGVDRLNGTGRVVVRSMTTLAHAALFVAGLSLDAEGNPQLVLDPDGLVAEARREGASEPAGDATRRPVLVIDDSLTTRMLEQSVLESAGYEVDLATSGEEGLEKARQREYALFLVDVEMPGIDGFTFVERVRADPSLHRVPAILVTSRDAVEDRRRGRDAGAQGYIVKSQFDQAELLAMIKPLVG